MKIHPLSLRIIAAILLAISPARAEVNLALFCTNLSNPALNPEGDGVKVHLVLTNTIQSLTAAHKLSGKIYDRTAQYKLLRLTQNSNGYPSYFWEGEMLKDQNVMMIGHLWQILCVLFSRSDGQNRPRSKYLGH